MELNKYFSDIYYHLHPKLEQIISHQGVRILQTIQKEELVTVRDIADALNISQNTASEHVKKLESNGWVIKQRRREDQRKVFLQLTTIGLEVVKQNTELDEIKLQQALLKLSNEEQTFVLQAFRILSEVVK